MKRAEIVIFCGGLIIGGVAGAASCWLLLKKKFDKKLDEEIERLNEEEWNNNLSYFDQEFEFEDPELNNDPSEEKDVGRNYHKISEDSVDYLEFYKKKNEELKGAIKLADPADFEHPEEDDSYISDYGDGVDPETVTVVNEENKNLVDGYEITKETAYSKDKKPKIITGDSYYNEFHHFDKIALQYYFDDDILATEEDEEIDDVERILGDSLDKYGFRNNDESVIYVRNMAMGTDYEVFKVRASFGEYSRM